MPQISKHRKTKKLTVLVKRAQCLRNYPKNKSYKLLCEKLKSNNFSLAKALSKEKHESQLLFSQNVALIAEVQDLGLACMKREAAISNILKNAKEMLKMLVTITGYLTNTISTCQEFATPSVINSQMSCNSAERRDSHRRQSTKSPTRGIVKPMVSGYTITKPTINLSRVNVQHINNSSNLSIIQEVPTPPRNQESNSPRTPVSVSVRQLRCENSRTCRMPERLTTTSSRNSDEDEERLSRRSSRRFERMSGRISRSKSEKLSRKNSIRSSIENFEHMGSPRVKLNDVSKLLQNSQSINIRMLTENRNNQGVDSSENSDGVNQEDSRTNIAIPETLPLDCSKDNNDKTVENESEQTDNELDSTEEVKENVNETQNASNWEDPEDPLEGPSWLFNNSQSVPLMVNKNKKSDKVNVSIDDSMKIALNATESNNISCNEKSMQKTLSLPMINKRENHAYNSKRSKRINGENECQVLLQNVNDETFCKVSTPTDLTNVNENECAIENEPTVNLTNFVTQRRGYFESEDDDDFTLMYIRQPRNMHFDINDLKLPVLEESALKQVVPAEPEPEITTTLRKISQICPIPSVSNNNLDESAHNQSTVKLPQLVNNSDDNKDWTPHKNKSKKTATRITSDFVDCTPVHNKKNNHKKDKSVNKNPSAVKVVLQKLSESSIKCRTPSPEVIPRNSNKSLNSPTRAENSSDSEGSTASSTYAMNRPRRKRAPTTFLEPNLRDKLRRK